MTHPELRFYPPGTPVLISGHQHAVVESVTITQANADSYTEDYEVEWWEGEQLRSQRANRFYVTSEEPEVVLFEAHPAAADQAAGIDWR